MFWCFGCSQNSSSSHCCPKCSSQAIQQVTSNNNPSSFKPYQITTDDSQYPLRSLDSLYRDLFSSIMGEEEMPVTSMRFSRRPNSLFELTYVIVMGDEDEQKKCLTQDEINKLKRIQIQEQCSICQQNQKGQGIELICAHKFHQNCIKPWLRQNNTCPCCRKQLNA